MGAFAADGGGGCELPGGGSFGLRRAGFLPGRVGCKAHRPAAAEGFVNGHEVRRDLAPALRQRVLLALTQAGVSREDAYRLVQRNAMKVWEHGADFLEELLADKDVRAALSEEDIREKFDLGYHTKHVDTIFRRVFG